MSDDYDCPNGSCEHSAYVHDIAEIGDPRRVCCIDSCPCGRGRGRTMIAPLPAEVSAAIDKARSAVNAMEAERDQARAIAKEACDEAVKIGEAHLAVIDQRDQAQTEAADLRALFDLQQTRLGEAVELWRAESPEDRSNVLPDLGALLTWLLDRDAKTRAVVEAATELSGAVDNQSRHYAEDVLAAAIDDLEGNYP